MRVLKLILLAAAVLVWVLLLRPASLGGPASYIIVSGVSMQPTLESGDLVVLQDQEAYTRGQVVAFEVPEGQPGAGSLVIHRIIGGSAEDGFRLQGDNNDDPDEWRPTPGQIKGSLWVRVPAVGAAVATLRDPAVFAPLAGGLVVVLVMLGGSEPRRKDDSSESTHEQRNEAPASTP